MIGVACFAVVFVYFVFFICFFGEGPTSKSKTTFSRLFLKVMDTKTDSKLSLSVERYFSVVRPFKQLRNRSLLEQLC